MPLASYDDDVSRGDAQADPHAVLAFAVLLKAVADATNSDVNDAHRDSARRFLQAQDPVFLFWCDAANVRPSVIAAAATARQADSRPLALQGTRSGGWQSRHGPRPRSRAR